jgi:hypothetical protein
LLSKVELLLEVVSKQELLERFRREGHRFSAGTRESLAEEARIETRLKAEEEPDEKKVQEGETVESLSEGEEQFGNEVDSSEGTESSDAVQRSGTVLEPDKDCKDSSTVAAAMILSFADADLLASLDSRRIHSEAPLDKS